LHSHGDPGVVAARELAATFFAEVYTCLIESEDNSARR
jgi:hypothetical protein